MPEKVTYKGPTDKADRSSVFFIDGRRFTKDKEVEVPAALAKELKDGSDRTKGHRFKVASETKSTAPDKGWEDTNMALTGAPFPYDITNLLGGAVRILYGDAAGTGAVAVPDSIADVIGMVAPYDAEEGWTDLGATKESFTYSRSFDTAGYEIQQVAGNVIEEITDIERSIEISYADLRPEHLQMIENAPSVATIAAAANASAQKKVAFGSFSSPVQYRFAFVSMRPRQAGVVVEPTDAERGRFFMGVANLAQIGADEISLEQAKGELTAAGVTFTMFPSSGEATGEEYGAWYDEQAGTMT